MCKTPGAEECKHNIDVMPPEDEDEDLMEHEENYSSEEENGSDSSEEENDSSENDSNYSDSDCESRCGRRLAPSMILKYLLIEKGILPTKAKDDNSDDDHQDEISDLMSIHENVLKYIEMNEGGVGASQASTADDREPEQVMDEDEDAPMEIDESIAVSKNEDKSSSDDQEINNVNVTSDEKSCENMENDIESTNDVFNKEEENEEVLDENNDETKGMSADSVMLVADIPHDDTITISEDIQDEIDTDASKMAGVENMACSNTNQIPNEKVLSVELANDSSKRTESIQKILEELCKEKLISEEEYMELESHSKKLDTYYDSNRAVDKFESRTRELRRFALFLNFYSPSAYKYVLKEFNTPLPGHKTLSEWYLQEDTQPGLSEMAFDILEKKQKDGKKLTCTLVAYDIFLQNYGLNYTQVDFGGGSNYEFTDKATLVYLIMLVGLDENWKIPIGYFLARRVPPETQAELIRICLTNCYNVGVDVVAVTLQYPTPAEFLGCRFDPKDMKTTFKHPDCDRELAVFLDPCLSLRSIQKTLKSKSYLFDGDEKIKWSLIKKIKGLYSNDMLDYEGQHSSDLLALRNHIAKVRLTEETLSRSLADALALAGKFLPNLFRKTEPMIKFITVLNDLYEILHSKTSQMGYKQPICPENAAEIMAILDKSKEYIMSIFSNEKNDLPLVEKEPYDPIEGVPISGFVSLLVTIESMKHVYVTLVEKEKRLKSIAMHRFCFDHIESFIQTIRLDHNISADDFNHWIFESFYTGLFWNLKDTLNLKDHCSRVENSDVNKKKAVSLIKRSSGKRAFDEQYSFRYKTKMLRQKFEDRFALKYVERYSNALDTEQVQYNRQQMVGYIAGWIAAKFATSLKCETCIDSLYVNKKLWFHKYITFRRLKGVCLPSEDLFTVCWESEKAIKKLVTENGLDFAEIQSVEHLERLKTRILGKFVGTSVFNGLNLHALEQSPANSHRIHLLRAVIAKYVPIRLVCPYGKRMQRELKLLVQLGEEIRHAFGAPETVDAPETE